ncbi:MAG: regulatory protein RecX, partial [Armatimonadota bacterium]|nr:regulatory protein RecX [Armatimonadota bacterium]
QPGRPGRCAVFLDGEYAFSMSAEELLEHRLRVGDVLPEERVHQLAEALERRRARERAARMLARRWCSEEEVRQRLRQQGFPPDVIELALEDLRQAGLLDDRRFAQTWVHDRLTAGRAGRERLAWELRARGVDRQVAEECLAEVTEADEFRLGMELAQRRYQRLRDEEPEAQRRKLASLLQRRGYSYDTIDKILRNILSPD